MAQEALGGRDDCASQVMSELSRCDVNRVYAGERQGEPPDGKRARINPWSDAGVKRWVRDRDRKLESNESWMYLGRGMMSRSIGRTCQRVRDCRRARVQVHRASGIGMASGERVVSIGRIRSVSVIRVTERGEWRVIGDVSANKLKNTLSALPCTPRVHPPRPRIAGWEQE